MLEAIDESDDESTAGEGKLQLASDDEEAEKVKAQKRAKQSPLHEHYVAPLSFLVEAANSGNSFNITGLRLPFGNNLEAYARPCYEVILQLILQKRKECHQMRSKEGGRRRAALFVIRGSSGIGKSTFLAFFMGRARSGKRFRNFALFYGSKTSRGISGEQMVSEANCYVMHNGEKSLKEGMAPCVTI